MNPKASIFVALLVVTACVISGHSRSAGQQAAGAPGAIAKRIGTVKTINGNALTLGQASGPEVSVTVEPTARILKLAPGEKDLKNATPLQLTELHVGDMVRVRGTGSADGNSISALEVIVITQAAVAAVTDQMKQDWQKRGTGGLVDSVDAASGNVTLSIPALAGKKTVVVHTSKETMVHRYAPDSARSEDAKPSSLAEIHVGDQLRARGNKNADGTEITAEEIYAGVFPQFAATVKSVDASSGTLSVQDLFTKKTVQVKVSADSQLHKIPAQMAQMFAMRLKGTTTAGTPGAAAAKPAEQKPGEQGNSRASSPGGSTWSGGGGGGNRSGGPPDLQRLLSRMPSTTLAEMNLQKGDAVMILATEGTATSPQTAITLLSGVEPILQASPNAQAMMLTPWNLGGGAAGGEASQ
jgi:hypothetical protein